MGCGSNRRILLRNLAIFLVIFLVGILIGALAGHYGATNKKKEVATFENSNAPNPAISDLLIKEVNAENIRQNLKKYTAHPHLAGTSADLEQAEQVKQQWLDQGLDRVDINSYDVLLSYPMEGDPNLISLKWDNGSTFFESQPAEAILRPEDIQPEDNIVPPFNAYSPPGDVTSQKLFYVNYGREEDFYWLKNNKSIELNDSIVIARYGKIFRGVKVSMAAEYGAKAIILYTDPYDFTSPTDNSSYPDSWWIPKTGVQRGTVMDVAGDPLTPFYPALDSAYRIDPTEGLPKIPAHPVSYDDARQLMQQLGGETVPEDWRGSITGLVYKLGGSFLNSDMKVSAHITTRNIRRRTYNVIGYITGSVEQDRYVVAGTHRDAWVYGALDPSSSAAAMMEVSRAITTVMKSNNWRPRRTIVFASWGAEEQGLLGSFEFTEHFSKVLGQRAVSYINADVLMEGVDFMRFKASPLLHTMVYDAAKKIPNPDEEEVQAGRTSVYDSWLHYFPSDSQPDKPRVLAIGSGSDYSPFQNVLGISCLEPRYTWDRNKWKLSSYPLYHTVYETFYLVDHIMDPGFQKFRAVAQVLSEVVRDLSDSLVLPLDVQSFSRYLKEESDKIFEVHEALMVANNLTHDIEYFRHAVSVFQKDAEELTEQIRQLDTSRPYLVREVNDKLMNLQRSFLDPQGLPGRPLYKNLLLAPSKFDAYSGAVFPAITDSLHRIEANTDPKKWEHVRKNMSIVTYILQTAASTLRKATEFSKV
ncbi:glutamate carboxypeptidase 2-like [Watersipora subatra]|uniref:glutamate carboxypeptidase 2-like n=1 Tax=Watersipora subatra TaxID=2589382 RepID=UPI00355B3789